MKWTCITHAGNEKRGVLVEKVYRKRPLGILYLEDRIIINKS